MGGCLSNALSNVFGGSKTTTGSQNAPVTGTGNQGYGSTGRAKSSYSCRGMLPRDMPLQNNNSWSLQETSRFTVSRLRFQ